MASAFEETETEIEELQRSVDTLTRELSEMSHRSRRTDGAGDLQTRSLPKLRLFDDCSDPTEDRQPMQNGKPRRKEIEARRFNGKESVTEYLVQFELTAKRNGWSKSEQVTNLLCALDGPARSILSEIDDLDKCRYPEVKELLVKRFGPVSLTEVHEQSLHDLKLGKGQSIRELSSEVVRLARLAYPEFDAASRARMSIKALTDAISDREAVFYIKDKNPASVDEVCTWYERFRVLHGEDDRKTRAAVRGFKTDADHDQASLSRDLTTALGKMAESTNAQLSKLTTAITQLTSTQKTAPPPVFFPPPTGMHGAAQMPAALPPPASTLSAAAPPFLPADSQRPQDPGVPRKPCPRCQQRGHWARDCPSPQLPADACFQCGRPGHVRRHCPSSLNSNGPEPASGFRPSAPPL